MFSFLRIMSKYGSNFMFSNGIIKVGKIISGVNERVVSVECFFGVVVIGFLYNVVKELLCYNVIDWFIVVWGFNIVFIRICLVFSIVVSIVGIVRIELIVIEVWSVIVFLSFGGYRV